MVETVKGIQIRPEGAAHFNPTASPCGKRKNRPERAA